MARTSTIERNTNETKIKLDFNIDGTGKAEIDSGVGFFDHMMNGFARHGLFDVKLKVKGDLEVDCHHTIEDTGIVLGNAIREAAGDKKGIKRYGSCILPMDETLVLCACDLSGRDYLGWAVDLPAAKVGDFDTELAKEFWLAFVRNCPASVHIRELAGENTHHILEAVFKGMGRTLKMAVAPDAKHLDEIPSTKGTL